MGAMTRLEPSGRRLTPVFDSSPFLSEITGKGRSRTASTRMCCWLLLPPSDRSYRPVWSVADVAQREWREYLLFADWDVIRPYGVVGGQWDKSGTMTASIVPEHCICRSNEVCPCSLSRLAGQESSKKEEKKLKSYGMKHEMLPAYKA